MNTDDFEITDGRLVRYSGSVECVRIPDGIREIGERAFMGCSSMKELILPEGVEVIMQSAFSPCRGLEKITFPASLHTLGEFAFSGCTGLRQLKLPDTINDIHRSAFSMCRSLQKVRIPEGVRAIPRGVFLGCTALKKVEITENVEQIDVDAFSGCTALMDFSVDGTNKYFRDTDGVLYSKDGKTLVFFPGGRIEIVIPEGTERIGDSAFYENRMFDRITLPMSLKSIGSHAFYRCTELMQLELPHILESVGESAFEGCGALISLVFPDSTAEIAESSFRSCRKLMWLKVPEHMDFDLHWFAAPHDPPCFSVDKSVIPFVNTRKSEDIDSEAGMRRAAQGFIQARIARVDVPDAISAGYMAYIRENVRDFYELILADEGSMRWMCENDMIPEEDIEGLLEGAAEKANAGASAMLLGYQKRRLIRSEAASNASSGSMGEEGPGLSAREQLENRFSALENALDF